ncbi:uncharacterized protein LOC131674307 [Phymastichus coffea]|uniref:uncharacterized protein LOC131674307 n=1 Tax=Phymastichus coffea TaxID=108790 RepID=UPI00273A760B|nr:uncharacterized protein LOC131674307 [Phymastichus coffea]
MTSSAMTQKQQRKSLSAKKGPIKGLKNVLANPHENYWPLLKHERGAALKNLLKRLLPVLKRTEQKVPWGQLRKLNKEERLAAKKAAQIQSNAEYDAEIAKFIVLGINAVTRLLEKNNTSVILLEAGVDPSLLVKHILDMAKNKNIPVVLIPFLKDISLETIGYTCAAISLKKDAESTDNYFYELYKKISELSAELPKPKTLVSLFHNESILEDNGNQMRIETIEEDVIATKPITVSTDVYLCRTSKKERAFVPNYSSHSKPNFENKWTDFIALNDEKNYVDQKKVPSRFFGSLVSDSDKNEHNNDRIQYYKRKKTLSDSDEPSAKVSYKPLKVKRLQGDQSRKKATKKPKVKRKK